MTKVLLSFDLEEFDLPLEYNVKLSSKEQLEFTLKGLRKLLKLLEKHNIKTTFFTTASFASKYPQILKQLAQKHEIASHNLHHNTKNYNHQEVEKSKQILERIINKKIIGFRFPRLKKPDFNSLKKLGFKYDSSISPSYIPGRYNNYFEQKKITLKNGIYEIPISTMPLTHLPLSWLFIRFFGLSYAKFVTKHCMKKQKFTNLFFHPWEFNNLKNFKIPFYIKRNSGDKALNLLEKYILWCKKRNYKFTTFEEFINQEDQFL
jgi:peptidoglycan/xylan/chitin deacetylase (PgdA/CDA1 family)